MVTLDAAANENREVTNDANETVSKHFLSLFPFTFVSLAVSHLNCAQEVRS